MVTHCYPNPADLLPNSLERQPLGWNRESRKSYSQDGKAKQNEHE